MDKINSQYIEEVVARNRLLSERIGRFLGGALKAFGRGAMASVKRDAGAIKGQFAKSYLGKDGPSLQSRVDTMATYSGAGRSSRDNGRDVAAAKSAQEIGTETRTQSDERGAEADQARAQARAQARDQELNKYHGMTKRQSDRAVSKFYRSRPDYAKYRNVLRANNKTAMSDGLDNMIRLRVGDYRKYKDQWENNTDLRRFHTTVKTDIKRMMNRGRLKQKGTDTSSERPAGEKPKIPRDQKQKVKLDIASGKLVPREGFQHTSSKIQESINRKLNIFLGE